jgi:hypothetical protein
MKVLALTFPLCVFGTLNEGIMYKLSVSYPNIIQGTAVGSQQVGARARARKEKMIF